MFFINDAMADAGQAAGEPSGMFQLLFFGGFMVLMYFLMIRPQTKRAKEHKAMMEAVSKGDEIVTSGGLIGKVTDVKEQHVKVKLADGMEILMEKQAISKTLPKGTIKAL